MYSRVVIVLLLLSMIAGYLERESHLRAAVPPACPQYKCRTIHAYWSGNKTFVSAFHVQNGTGNADDGAENIFTTNSTENLPFLKTTGNIDLWQYPSCTPFCGKDIAGKWQATQEVLKSGAKDKDSKSLIMRQPCTATANGAEGPTNANPANANSNNGYTPPGVVDEPDLPPEMP